MCYLNPPVAINFQIISLTGEIKVNDFNLVGMRLCILQAFSFHPHQNIMEEVDMSSIL